MSTNHKGNIFTFSLNQETDKDIIDYIKSSNQNNSLVIRELSRTTFNYSDDYHVFKRLIETKDVLEKTLLENTSIIATDNHSNIEEKSSEMAEQNKENENDIGIDFSGLQQSFGGFEKE